MSTPEQGHNSQPSPEDQLEAMRAQLAETQAKLAEAQAANDQHVDQMQNANVALEQGNDAAANRILSNQLESSKAAPLTPREPSEALTEKMGVVRETPAAQESTKRNSRVRKGALAGLLAVGAIGLVGGQVASGQSSTERAQPSTPATEEIAATTSDTATETDSAMTGTTNSVGGEEANRTTGEHSGGVAVDSAEDESTAQTNPEKRTGPTSETGSANEDKASSKNKNVTRFHNVTNVASFVNASHVYTFNDAKRVIGDLGGKYTNAELNNNENKMNGQDEALKPAKIHLAAGAATLADSTEGNNYGKAAINFNSKYNRAIDADTGLSAKKEEARNAKFFSEAKMTIDNNYTGWVENGYMKDGGAMNAQREYFNGEKVAIFKHKTMGTVMAKITRDKTDGKICINWIKEAPAPVAPVAPVSGGSYDAPVGGSSYNPGTPGYNNPGGGGENPNPRGGVTPVGGGEDNPNPGDNGRGHHPAASGPPPEASQPPHKDTATPTPGYTPGGVENLPDQNGDPGNLNPTPGGTRAPEGSPSDGGSNPNGGTPSPDHVPGSASPNTDAGADNPTPSNTGGDTSGPASDPGRP